MLLSSPVYNELFLSLASLCMSFMQFQAAFPTLNWSTTLHYILAIVLLQLVWSCMYHVCRFLNTIRGHPLLSPLFTNKAVLIRYALQWSMWSQHFIYQNFNFGHFKVESGAGGEQRPVADNRLPVKPVSKKSKRRANEPPVKVSSSIIDSMNYSVRIYNSLNTIEVLL